MNPITLPNNPVGFKFGNLGEVVTAALQFIYVIGGLVLLVVLIMGGITLMTASGDQNKTKQGYGMITNAIIGFLIIFVSYFVMQIVEVVLGIKIL